MSTKYSTGGRASLLPDGVALTDHARHRYRERTPHDCHVTIREAYRRGEDIRDPAVTRGPTDTRTPQRARVYRHGDDDPTGWGVVFLICDERRDEADRPAHQVADRVVVTVMDIGGYEHGPSRAYLESHGPHGGGE
jgi:hypothetical protein